MKIFTIENGKVTAGAAVQSFSLKSAGTTIPAIIVGEEGRGRSLGVLPVALIPEQEAQWAEFCAQYATESVGNRREIDAMGYTYSVTVGGVVRRPAIQFGALGQTKAGKPKLFASTAADFDSRAVVVLQTPIGYRGGNSHSGDRVMVPCRFRGSSCLYAAPKCGHCGTPTFGLDAHPDIGTEPGFLPFPGEVIVQGRIAQGDAGNMGSGEQMVAVVRKGDVFRTGYSGRRYGAPGSHYYVFDGERILSATRAERDASDLF